MYKLIFISFFLCFVQYLISQTIENKILIEWANASGSIMIPAGVEAISANVFADNVRITSVNTNEVKVINGSVFQGCLSLKKAVMPNVKTIGNRAFQSCITLDSVSMPNVMAIGKYGFYNCNALLSVFIPNIESLDSHSFDKCNKLRLVDLSNSSKVSFVASDAFLDQSFLNIFTSTSEIKKLFPTEHTWGLYHVSDCFADRMIKNNITPNFSLAIIMTTILPSNSNVNLGVVAKSGYIQVDWGNGIKTEYQVSVSNNNPTRIEGLTAVESAEIKIYGNDIVSFNCDNNQLIHVGLVECSELIEFSCMYNNMDACAMDSLFKTLSYVNNDFATHKLYVHDKLSLDEHNDAYGSNRYIATEKKWVVYVKEGNSLISLSGNGNGCISSNTVNTRKDIILIYPNPAKGIICICVNEGYENAVAKIFNLFGNVVYETQIQERKVMINISNLPVGMYLIQIQDQIKKIIVE